MRRPNPILALIALLAFVVSSQPSSFDLPAASQDRQIKWPTKNIQIALSTSLTAPSPAIKPASDVLGAVERALASWSQAANVKFVEGPSKAQSVSPANSGDGISLITVAATAENLALFSEENTTARTRVFYDPDTGAITEADIVINPFPYSGEGEPLQFSTDGTPGTYDLESTLAHEIGHLLGLNHSHVIGATMQAFQALNGTYGLPAITERTLSEADEAAVRTLYGVFEKTGSIEGKILNSIGGSLLPATAAHVWIEDLATGKVTVVTDRTTTIRAAIADVQFTLVLTVALVVMVIFVFLRKFWATVIPSIALPLTLIATFGVMKLAGFSLDNLSLMALTISTGFVVDDAIVMIENIVRFIEAGDPPLQAALKGARQIGFTVISLSVSLVAVFIPLIFMTGIVGRLFREFAITLSVAVVVSAIVSLTLTPMMCARLLEAEDKSKQGRFYLATERMFQ